MHRFTSPLLVLAILAVGTGGAEAKAVFSRVDGNGDNVVSFEEARRVAETLSAVHFRKFDRDRDGVLSRREYPGFDAFLDLMYDR